VRQDPAAPPRNHPRNGGFVAALGAHLVGGALEGRAGKADARANGQELVVRDAALWLAFERAIDDRPHFVVLVTAVIGHARAGQRNACDVQSQLSAERLGKVQRAARKVQRGGAEPTTLAGVAARLRGGAKVASFVRYRVMAWSPLALRNTRLAVARRLVARTSALLGNSATLLDQLRKSGGIPSPLYLALRAANKLAQTLAEHPAAPPTAAQRRALLAAAAQIRTMAGSILITGSASDPGSVEFQLAELITRTLALIDQVTAEPLTIDTTLDESEPKLGDKRR
jgi:hypothetical protein